MAVLTSKDLQVQGSAGAKLGGKPARQREYDMQAKAWRVPDRFAKASRVGLVVRGEEVVLAVKDGVVEVPEGREGDRVLAIALRDSGFSPVGKPPKGAEAKAPAKKEPAYKEGPFELLHPDGESVTADVQTTDANGKKVVVPVQNGVAVVDDPVVAERLIRNKGFVGEVREV